ncbi:porin [Stutzerimonas urumqiensis]|uniref:porin n=1 Tax=Stutzerimonas urumqiensis TaxID=638269 RepID=UPI000EB25953|nr:porin [Stutzerimonas urumqiensis]
MSAVRVLGLAAACLAASPAFALEQGEYRFNGFGTVGITHLGGEDDGRAYGIQGQTNDSWRGDQLSKLGGQFQYGLTDKLGLTAQVIAKAEQDNWKANLEWLYLSYQVDDRLVVRAGRLRNPVYMYSETLDVGFTYPWLRLPDEVYHQVQITNYEGADFVYTLPLSFGSLSLQANGGQAVNRNFFVYDQLRDMDYKKVAGANAALATNSFGTFRVGYSESSLSLDGFIEDRKGKFTSLGYQFDNGTWITANEATRLVVEGATSTKDAFYLMGGRRFGDFLAHVTYAQMDESNAGGQSSWTYGLNYSLTPTVTLKGEYKRVDTYDQGKGVFVKSFDELVSEAFGVTTPRTFDGDIVSVGVDFVF